MSWLVVLPLSSVPALVLLVPLLVLQVHQPDDGAAVGVDLLLILLGALLPQLLLIIGRLTPEVKDNERTERSISPRSSRSSARAWSTLSRTPSSIHLWKRRWQVW
jgi:hypothetical protein